jgi:hypothetical protein
MVAGVVQGVSVVKGWISSKINSVEGVGMKYVSACECKVMV